MTILLWLAKNWKLVLAVLATVALAGMVIWFNERGHEIDKLNVKIDGLNNTIEVQQKAADLAKEAQQALADRLAEASKERGVIAHLTDKAQTAPSAANGDMAPVMRDTLRGLRDLTKKGKPQ